jgi:biopolymer transport protein ExbD
MGESAEMTVLLGADGQLALDGEEMAAEALQAAVAARLETAPETRLRLKADGAAEATGVVAVMERLRAAGVERLKLLTLPEGG